MFEFNRPALLTGKPYDPLLPISYISSLLVPDNDRARAIAVKASRTGGIGVLPVGKNFDARIFARLLAKIAHAFAVAELGHRRFTHILPPIILGKHIDVIFNYVGSMPYNGVRASYTHHVEGHLDHARVLTTHIHLFGLVGFPVHTVVTGVILPGNWEDIAIQCDEVRVTQHTSERCPARDQLVRPM